MNRDNKQMLISMSQTKFIPEITAAITERINELSVDTIKEEANAIFTDIETQIKELDNRITQLKSLF